MEVIRSTNIVFNNKDPHGSNVGNGKSLYRNNATKPGPSQQNGGSPRKGATSESPIKSVQPSPMGVTESPKFLSPAKVGAPVPTEDSPGLEDSPLFKRVHDLPGHPVLETPTSWKKRESPADSGIEMTPISISPTKVSNPKLRTMYNNSRREADESTDFSINPDPVPYQSSNFIAGRSSRLEGADYNSMPTSEPSTMSSTMMKKVPVARRHYDTFGTYDFMAGIAKRGMMLHTDRYQWDLAKALDGLSQRERLQAELEYMERLRGIKRRREVLPHRAQLDLLMGGKKVEFNERFEIQREIQKLKSLILPQHAKDLFHGRGFTLPDSHNSLKPRRPFDPNLDLADELTSPFSPDKYSINPETGRVQPKVRQYPEQSSSLPKINNKGYLLGHGSPIILSKEKRTVEGIKARLRIPTKNFRAQKGEPIPVQTPNPFNMEMEDTWTPYVTRQSTMTSPTQLRPGSKSPAVPWSPRRFLPKASESPDLTLYPVSQGMLVSPRYGTGLGSSNQAYMTRSKTNVTTSQGKPGGIGGRSLTAQQPKNVTRQPITATTTKPIHVSHKAEITIPVSARDPEDPEESTPAVPKSSTSTHKNVIEEENDDIVLEEWPDVEETTDQGNDGRNITSGLSAPRSVSSPLKAPTPNPLKAVELVRTMSEDEQARLKQTFNKLDTDKDGHIMFSQLQTQLPKQFSQAQEKYIKQVYDITSSNTFFGVDEFMTMSYLTNVVTSLTGEPKDAYNKLEFHGLHDVILQYVELFQTVDRNHRGKIALTSLQDILQTALSIDFKTEPPIWNKILDTIDNENLVGLSILENIGYNHDFDFIFNEPMTITKIEFLAHIPYFQTLGKKK